MNIIIPMAGEGKRMRPHTLTTPKPLIPIAGKPIVQRLVEDIKKVCPEKIENIGFVIGDFGKEVEKQLLAIAKEAGAEGHIFHQKEALGPGHAVFCAEKLITGKTLVAFSDTLFKADFKINTEEDGVILVHKVENPGSFGVVQVGEDNYITLLVEKPENYVSDLAIIGIYYFKDGDKLRNELENVINNNIKVKGEFQLTSALENLKNKGTKFVPQTISEWLDCGNKDATVKTNKRYLEYLKDEDLVSKSAKINNSVIIPPVFLGDKVEVYNSVIGPYVSVGAGTIIKDSIVRSSIIQRGSTVTRAILDNSMLGNFVNFEGTHFAVSIGDYNWLEI